MQLQNKSLIERIVHAVGFEAIAVMVCPAGRVAAEPLNGAGRCVGGDVSTVAMLWNMVYNTVFDRLWPVGRVVRNLKVRALHAVGFEAGFILIGVPIAAWMLSISWAQAFMLEIGFFLFFLPYTMAYNWLYDTLRQRWFEARQPINSGAK